METSTNEQMITRLADGNTHATKLLTDILNQYPERFTALAFDLENMQMRGDDIEEAVDYCISIDEDFISVITRRDKALVEHVRDYNPDSPIRQHGPQLTIKPVDAAVQNILNEAAQKNMLDRIDEGAEYVHAYWLKMITEMQKSQKFTSNMRVNLAGMFEGGGWAVFAINLVELIGPDGKPLGTQLKDEALKLGEDDPKLKPEDPNIDDSATTLL